MAGSEPFPLPEGEGGTLTLWEKVCSDFGFCRGHSLVCFHRGYVRGLTRGRGWNSFSLWGRSSFGFDGFGWGNSFSFSLRERGKGGYVHGGNFSFCRGCVFGSRLGCCLSSEGEAGGKGGVPGDGRGGYISGDGLRRRLRQGEDGSLGKPYRACLSIGKQVNDDLDALILTIIENKGTQPVLVSERGDHALTVGAEVYIGDIRTKSAWNLLKCGVQVTVEHDSQRFPLYLCAVGNGPRPIEHDASKIVMRPGARHNGHDFRPTAVNDRHRRGCSRVRLLAVAWAASNEYPHDQQPKHAPTC